MNNTQKNRLKYHVTGAIERGDAQAIVEMPPLHKGPFPLHITQNEDYFVIVTSQGNHYAKTFDPSAARLIAAAPNLISTLEKLLACASKLDQSATHDGLQNCEAIAQAREALRKAKGEA